MRRTSLRARWSKSEGSKDSNPSGPLRHQLVTVARSEPVSDRAVLLELRPARRGSSLVPFAPGAHVDIHLSNRVVRQYSLVGSDEDASRYLVCVQREDQGRGGSLALHQKISVGDPLRISLPRNTFGILPDTSTALLLGGGVGVTPLTAMAHRLHAQGIPFTFHVYAKRPSSLPLRDFLDGSAYRSSVYQHFSDDGDSFRSASPDGIDTPTASGAIYVCGPDGFIDAARARADAFGWASSRIVTELFAPQGASSGAGAAFDVIAASTGQRMTVGEDETIADVLEGHGYDTRRSCGQGYCGSCVTRVVDGLPDHRDDFQSDEEHAANDQINLCCSRALTPELTLDL